VSFHQFQLISTLGVKGHQNLITFMVHHNTYSYRFTQISDRQFFVFFARTDRLTHIHPPTHTHTHWFTDTRR